MIRLPLLSSIPPFDRIGVIWINKDHITALIPQNGTTTEVILINGNIYLTSFTVSQITEILSKEE